MRGKARPSLLVSCPLTRGLPTWMIEAKFRELCAARREDKESHCYLACRGESLPDGLEFITVEILKEETMGAIIKNADCGICGKKANLRNCLGKTLCASCDFVWRSINAKPESVLEALKEKMGDQWIQYRLPVDVSEKQTPPPEGEALVYSAEDLAALHQENVKLREDLAIASSGIDALKQQLACSREEITTAYGLINELQAELDAAQQQIEDIEKEFDEQCVINKQAEEEITRLGNIVNGQVCSAPVPSAAADSPLSRDAVLLDLALGVLTGRVVGVDAATIYSLRQ